jgi:gentisate 1,2-dioxygenase
MEGEQRRILVGIMLSTPGLTAGRIELLPGQSSDLRTHAGDLALFVEHGMLNVLMPDADTSTRWSELHPADGFYAPAGTPHRYFNQTDEPVSCLFAVAPSYLPEAAT